MIRGRETHSVSTLKIPTNRELPRGLVVKNHLQCSGALVQSLVRKTRSHILHAAGQLSLCMGTTEPVCHNKLSHVPQLKPNIVPVNIQVHHNVSQPDQSMEVLFRKVIQYLCPVKFTVSSPVMIFSLTVAFFLGSHSAVLNSVCP